MLSFLGIKIFSDFFIWLLNMSREIMLFVNFFYNFFIGFIKIMVVFFWMNFKVFDISFNKLYEFFFLFLFLVLFYSVVNNILIGEILLKLCSVVNFCIIDLFNNRWNGIIFCCLGNLNNFLFILNLRGNRFYGIILGLDIGICNLRLLDLSFNNF